MRITLLALYDVYSYGIRTIAMGLRNAGHEVTCIFYKTSTYVDNVWTTEEIEKIAFTVIDSKPDIVAIGVRSPLRLLAIELYKQFKYIGMNAPIVIGGHHATIMPEDCLSFGSIACAGEGYYPMIELANKGINKLSEISNFYPQPMARLDQNLDKLLFPYYTPKNDIYIDTEIDFGAIDAPVGIMLMSSRGCFFSCSFCFSESLKQICSGLGKYVRRRSVDNVLAELTSLKQNFPNLKTFPFADNVFTFGDRWIDEFCEKIKDYDVQFRCFSHFNMMKKPMLQKLVDVGLNCVTVGFQHGSERIRKDIFCRTETNQEILNGSELLANLGIQVRYDLITKILYETEQDKFEEEKLLANMVRPFCIRRFDLRHYPKTSLTKQLLQEGHITQSDVEGWKLPPFGKYGFAHFQDYEDN